MKIIDTKRGEGKTKMFIEASDRYGLTVVVDNEVSKNYALTMAYDFNLKNATVITYEEYCKLEKKPKHILVDEVALLLRLMFRGSYIVAATMSSCDESYNGWPLDEACADATETY